MLLIDVLFDGYHSSTALEASVYGEYLNSGYTHSISDAELTDLVMDLESRRLVWKKVAKRNEQSRTLLTLSDAGFQLWELERIPDWRSFVITSQRELGLFASGSPDDLLHGRNHWQAMWRGVVCIRTGYANKRNACSADRLAAPAAEQVVRRSFSHTNPNERLSSECSKTHRLERVPPIKVLVAMAWGNAAQTKMSRYSNEVRQAID